MKSEKSLKGRIARGGFWLGIGSSAEQFLRLARNIILVRVLIPEAFGTMAIVLAVNMFFEAFTEVGVKEAIVRDPRGESDVYLNGAWFFANIRAMTLTLIAYFIAPYISGFYNDPHLTSMLRVSFLYIILRGLLSPKTYVAVKQMKFSKWILVEQLGGVIGILTTIVLSFILKNAWALVIGYVVEGFARFILSYIVCPFLPRFNFNREDIHSLLNFARGMIGLPFLTFIFLRIDVFVIGKLCTSEQLGLYSMVLALANVPSLLFSKLITPMLTPVFSEMQSDLHRVNNSLLKINKIFGFIGVPLIVFTIFYSNDLLTIMYTQKYAEAAIPFSILFTIKMITNFGMPIVSIYISLGRPELHRLFALLRAVIVMIIIYPMVKFFGMTGASASLLFSLAVAYIFQMVKLSSITKVDIAGYFKIFLNAFIISIPIIIVFIIFKPFSTFHPIVNLLIGSTGFAVTLYYSYLHIFGKNGVGIES